MKYNILYGIVFTINLFSIGIILMTSIVIAVLAPGCNIITVFVKTIQEFWYFALEFIIGIVIQYKLSKHVHFPSR